MERKQELILAVVATALIVSGGFIGYMTFIANTGPLAGEEKPSITIWYTPTHYGDSEDGFAAMVKQQIEETGNVKVELESAEWATYSGEYIAQGVMPGFLLGWYPDYVDPNNYLNPFLYSENSPYLGVSYNDTGMDTILDRAKVAPTRDERADLYERAQMKLAREAPMIPVYQGNLITASRENAVNNDSIHLGTPMRLRYDYINGSSSITMDTTDSISHLDPAKAYDFFTWESFNNFNEGLINYVPGTTELAPGLAVNWTETGETSYINDVTNENESCATTWTYDLREGLHFRYYDEEIKTRNWKFNASTVQYSLRRVARLAADPSFLVTGTVKNTTTVGNYTIKFHLKRDVSYFPALSASVPYQPVDPEVWPKDEVVAAPDTISGLGPFVAESWTPKSEIQYVANPDYYDPVRPYADSFTVKIVSEASVMSSRIKAGETDLAWKTLTPTQVEDLEGTSGVEVKQTPGPYIRYIVLRCNKEPFDSLLLRRAVAMALDRGEITEQVYKDTASPLYSMVPDGMWSHIPAFKREYGTRNLDRATELFDRSLG